MQQLLLTGQNQFIVVKVNKNKLIIEEVLPLLEYVFLYLISEEVFVKHFFIMNKITFFVKENQR